MDLIISYIRLAIRQAKRKKLYAAISIVGLTLSFLSTFIIANYVGFEHSFDTMHKNYNNIYRVTTEWNNNKTSDDKRATTVQWSGPGVKETFPEVEAFTRLMPLSRMTGENTIEYKGKSISETNIMLADPGFFHVFSFNVLRGNSTTMLSKPRSVVISQSIAKKYFGDSDPVGQPVSIETHGNLNGNDFTVTGVIEDAPVNSHFSYDFLVSFNSMWKSLDDGSTYWHWDNTYCYLLLREGNDPIALGDKITNERVRKFSSEFGDWTDNIDFKLQPLRDIHLYSSLKGEIGINGNGKYLGFLAVLAFGILISACINFVNLSVSRAIERQTEIGIRKVNGSRGRQLFFQFGLETVLIVITAVVLSTVLMPLAVSSLEGAFNLDLPGSFFEFVRTPDLFAIIGIIFLLITLSLVYPLFIVKSMNPVTILKGHRIPMGAGGSLRNHLVVAQFFVCLLFSMAAVILFFQVKFMREHNPGFDREQVVVVRGYGFQPYSVHENFKNRLLTNPSIASVAMSSAAPGDEVIELSLRPKVWIGNSNDKSELKYHMVDDEFFPALGISLTAGRNFDQGILSDKNTIIVNERATRVLGFKDPAEAVSVQVNGLSDKPMTIIGVVSDYHQRSFRADHEPIVFAPAWSSDFGWNSRYHFIKLKPSDDVSADWFAKQALFIQEKWNESSPTQPFNYFFLDSYFDSQYQSEIYFSALFTFFSGFTVLITFLGLFGVVANMTIYRAREVAIRKILGASAENILLLMSRSFMRTLIIATIISIPVAFLIAGDWLKAFAFRISLTPWMFLLPVIATGIIIILIVVLRSIRMIYAQPAESLRYE